MPNWLVTYTISKEIEAEDVESAIAFAEGQSFDDWDVVDNSVEVL